VNVDKNGPIYLREVWRTDDICEWLGSVLNGSKGYFLGYLSTIGSDISRYSEQRGTVTFQFAVYESDCNIEILNLPYKDALFLTVAYI
jgi:hypothetical protein